MTETLTTLELDEWQHLFATLYDDPKSLRKAVLELRRIAEFYGLAFLPSFEEVVEEVRTKPHNLSECGHAPSFDQVAYRVLIGWLTEDSKLPHLPSGFQKLIVEHA